MRVVVLGTGTDVGKTYVTAALARGLAERTSVLALKPIESGTAAGGTGDAGALANAAGHPPALSPWRFERPVSPHLGARERGTLLDVREVADWVALQARDAQRELVLIESAGGALSPLGLGLTNVDLALALEPTLWLLVAPDSLGVLHDVTSTLRAMPRRPDAVLLSRARVPDESTGSNAGELARLGITPVLEVIGRGEAGCPLTVGWVLEQYRQRSGSA
jgi:dethiobiotin synthetase